MRKTLFLCLLCLFLAMGILPAAAAAERTVMDGADMMTDAAEAELTAVLNGITGSVRYYVVTSNSRFTVGRIEDLCDITPEDAVVVLAVDRTDGVYYYEMFTFNEADDLFSDRDANALLDDPEVYDNIKSGNVGEGAKLFVTKADARLKQARAELPKKAAIVGVVVAVLAAGGSMLGVALFYRRKRHGESYPLDRYANLNLTISEDRFVGSHVTRVRRQSNSSGGRSGGGGSVGGSRGRR